ncbi:MAG: putative inorganic carbon transporter subunit DabA, partial [Nitrospinota bacterium]|nr:putative inorganic carbon transporter subunit DabA [Nitrospinota bacterium]
YGLYKDYQTRGLPGEIVGSLEMYMFAQEPLRIDDLNRSEPKVISNWEQNRQKQEFEVQALMLLHFAKSIDVSVSDILKTPDTLETLLKWIEEIPEPQHGPVWLKALEGSFIKSFLKKFDSNIEKIKKADAKRGKTLESRPLSQSIFCIDVRSECFRRHLEEIGGNETFGFAGFFGVPLCYEGFTSEQQTDQCPVLLKPKHIIKEIPRAYQAKAAKEFLEGHQLAKAGNTLLHDLKENVITPYVMVEAIGWFFGLRLFGQTLRPKWFKTAVSWIKKLLAVPIGTTLTVDKIQREEAFEMVAAKHRATIYRLLVEKLGQLGGTVPHNQVEYLRKLALNETELESSEIQDLCKLLQWTESDLEQFVRTLHRDFNLHERDLDGRLQRITQAGFTVDEQVVYVETALRILGFKTFARLILLCAHGSTSDNNPFESALDCGACGGNHGVSNARALAVMANKPEVRQLLANKGLAIPVDTHFLPGQHDTTTDQVELFDLEDVPAAHRKDLIRLQRDLEEAGEKNSRERLGRLPDEPDSKGAFSALGRTKVRSIDWSQVRPEWGLSRHTAFIVGRRLLTEGINLEGRTFLHSYDSSKDPDGKYLEIIMTAPMIVAQWINMEHYFSTVDQEVYGAGSKAYHNIVGRIGVMFGTQSDLCVGLPLQTVYDGEKPFHEPMRLFVIMEAPRKMITTLIARHTILQRLTTNQWLHIVALDPEPMEFFLYQAPNDWKPLK